MKAETVHKRASELRKNREVAGRIAELKAPAVAELEGRISVDLNRTLFENARVGLSDIRRALTPGGEILDPGEWDDDTAHAVAAYEVKTTTRKDDDGMETVTVERKIKLWDKGAALDRLGKHLGFYERDNAQKSSNLFDGMPREQVKAILAALNRGRGGLLG